MVAEREAPATREVVCTHCDRPLDVAASAMSVSCPHCNRRLIIEDLKIKSYHAVVRLATAGRVEVLKNVQVVADVRVRELVVDGLVKGNVTAVDRVQVTKRGGILGNVTCRRLQVEAGARVEGFLRIGPEVEVARREAPETGS
jgi:cytoskeletal protein CcmA (bactofilin family)